MKRIILCLLCLVLLTGCVSETTEQNSKPNLKIVATLFPQYDFARTIAGEDAEVTLLLPPGAESHSYEPSPADIIKINEADLFIYTGEAMEAWVPSVLDSLEKQPVILDMSAGIELHQGHDHEDGEHQHNVDPHIFTNPLYAMTMAKDLEAKLCEIDPTHSEDYKKRGQAFYAELNDLHQQLSHLIQNAKRNKLIFGGRFAFLYFTEAYGLSYEAAFDSCSSESEPSAADVIHIIDTVKTENIPVVYYEELSDPKTAHLICEETGAKPLLLHSCHNVSKEELSQGATYLSLMRKNAEHLKEGLN